MNPFRGWHRINPERRTTRTGGLDNGPVIALVGPAGHGSDVADWATAEADVRGSEVRFVHSLRWLPAEKASSTLVAAARAEPEALVVLGRHCREHDAVVQRVARRTTAAVALVGLARRPVAGPSTGRVVVAADSRSGRALGSAFRAARRRGVGLTVVHPNPSTGWDEVTEEAGLWSLAYREVDVRLQPVNGPLDSVVVRESAAAALTVVGPDRLQLLRRTRGPTIRVGPAIRVRSR